jgi:SAM-dependent methyltransferase
MPNLYSVLKCPADAGDLHLASADELVCASCSRHYAVQNGVVRLLRAKEDNPADAEPVSFLGKTGDTGHLGAQGATAALLDKLDLRAAANLLELGCGTGGTTIALAQQTQANIIAVDFQFSFLERAAARLAEAGLRDRVLLVEADAHAFPFRDACFDAVLVESVLVFCRAAEVVQRVFRGLEPGGALAANEVTIFNQNAIALSSVLSEKFNLAELTICDEAGWKTLFEGAGFEGVQAQMRPVNVFSLLLNPFTRGILKALPPGTLDSFGYGLYTARKPDSYSNLTQVDLQKGRRTPDC